MASVWKYAVTPKDVDVAYSRIKGQIHKTPVVTSQFFNDRTGKQVFFKCENLQKTGAFKFRGASSSVMSLPDSAKVVVTHSSGNFAQACALAAKLRGLEAQIVMPNNAPNVKQNAVRGYGATVTLCEPTLVARKAAAAKLMKRDDTYLLHPYNDPPLIAGHGSLVRELEEQIDGDLDAILTPIGGGGLCSGITIAVQSWKHKPRIVACEALGANNATRFIKAGKVIPPVTPQTIADGLKTGMEANTFPIVRDLVDKIITVTEDEIKQAMRFMFERTKMVVEPSGAVSVAVLLSEEFRKMKDIQRVAVVLSGGNVDPAKLAELFKSKL